MRHIAKTWMSRPSLALTHMAEPLVKSDFLFPLGPLSFVYISRNGPSSQASLCRPREQWQEQHYRGSV